MRRFLAALLLLILAAPPVARAQGDDDATWAALRGGGVLLMRHAAPNREHDAQTLMRAEDCDGRRWLSPAGQEQARGVGERLRAEGVGVGAVLTSPLCPARETAEFLGLDAVEPRPSLRPVAAGDSLWASRAADPLRALVADWRGPGALVLVTHLGTVAALTGLAPDAGEGLVLLPDGPGFRLVGRLRPE